MAGPARVEVLLPQILDNCRNKDNAYTREGNLTVFKFLPLAMPQGFQVCVVCVCGGVVM